MSWQDAFIGQAWSDYQVFQELNKSRYPNCHKLHYLQMTTEKLAKGCLSEIEGGAPPKMTHVAFVRFLQYTKSYPLWKKRLGYEQNKRAYATYINRVIPIADKIQRLAPGIGGLCQANPEYPWSPRAGEVKCPAEYDFPEIKRHELGMIAGLVSSLFRALGFR